MKHSEIKYGRFFSLLDPIQGDSLPTNATYIAIPRVQLPLGGVANTMMYDLKGEFIGFSWVKMDQEVKPLSIKPVLNHDKGD